MPTCYEEQAKKKFTADFSTSQKFPLLSSYSNGKTFKSSLSIYSQLDVVNVKLLRKFLLAIQFFNSKLFLEFFSGNALSLMKKICCMFRYE